MRLLEILGLVSIKTSAERLKKLQNSFDEKIKKRDAKIESLSKDIELLNSQKSILREKLYKANNWQVHVEVKRRDLSHSNLSTLLESELIHSMKPPFTFIDIAEFTQIGQEGKIRVYVNKDRDDVVYLYFSYTIN